MPMKSTLGWCFNELIQVGWEIKGLNNISPGKATSLPDPLLIRHLFSCTGIYWLFQWKCSNAME